MGAVVSFFTGCSRCCDTEQQPPAADEAAEEAVNEAVAEEIELDEPAIQLLELEEEEQEEEEEIDPEAANQALRLQTTALTERLGVDIRDVFAADLVSVPQYQRLQREERNIGPIAMYTLLLDNVLEAGQAVEFIRLLRVRDRVIHDELVAIIRQIGCGEVQVYGREIDEIRNTLIEAYRGNHYHLIRALSGEKFQLNVDHEDSMMPVDFSTIKREEDERQRYRLPEAEKQVYYSDIKFDKLEEIVYALGKEKDSNTVQVMANAGTGKTVAVHRIICQWVSDCKNKQGLGNQYDLVFGIALRDVNIDYSLLEMLGKGRNRLGYIHNNQMDEVEKILQNALAAARILFILDGLDEKTIPESSDIFKLLVGDLYKNVKVLFTCRPEAPVLAKLKRINPMFKVEIHGTTKEGVYQYLRNTLSQASDEEINQLIYQCESKMVEFETLKIPIYLTIIGYVFDELWRKHFSFQPFVVPDTVTKLFNIFVSLLLRVWLERLGRKEEAAQLQLHCMNNPIAPDSRVPKDIKLKMAAFGELSFISLLNEKYDFNEHDLEKGLISETDISQSGMFCISTSADGPVYFYRHKQIQEFFAALYLSHKQFEDRSFYDIIKNSVRKTQKPTIKDVFIKIDRVMPFLFGLGPNFAAQILQQLQSNICVIGRNGFMNVDYEAMLCAEACNQQVTEAMGDLLISADVMVDKVYKLVSPISSVYKLCTGFSTTQHKTLLNNWYKLNLYQEAIDGGNVTWNITAYNSKNYNELKIDKLNEVLYFILCNYIFPNVKSLKVTNSCIFHPGVILRVFPSLTRMEIGNTRESGRIVLDEDVVSVIPQCVTQNTSLTHLTMLYDHYIGYLILLPQCTVSNLLSLSQLSTLTLVGVDILTYIDRSCDIHLPHLYTLKMLVNDTTCAELTHLLTGTPQLTVLDLKGTSQYERVRNSFFSTQLLLFLSRLTDLLTLTLDCVDILSLLSHLTNLHTLTLDCVDILTHIDPSCDIHLPHLHTLQLTVEELTDATCAGLTHLLTGAPQLTVLELMGTSIITTPHSLLSHLTNLHTLTLVWVEDILTQLDPSCDIHLPHLHTLQMTVEKPTDAMCAGLTHLLTGAPQLTVLALRCRYNPTQAVSSLQPLVTLPKLNTLVLCNVIRWRDVPVLCDKLQHMTGLVKLGLGWEELEQGGDCDPVGELSQAVASVPHLTHLYGMYESEKDDAEAVVEALRKHCPPHVQVNSHQWKWLSSLTI